MNLAQRVGERNGNRERLAQRQPLARGQLFAQSATAQVFHHYVAQFVRDGASIVKLYDVGMAQPCQSFRLNAHAFEHLRPITARCFAIKRVGQFAFGQVARIAHYAAGDAANECGIFGCLELSR